MVWFFIYCILSFSAVYGSRNAAEEAICQPFLTSRATSPLVGTLKRNLKVDEDGEFACELVLQDTALPIQIRATIHEGLSWLAIRHVGMGLEEHRKVVRHLRALSLLAPYSYSFQSRAGMWGMDEHIGEPEKAVINLYAALYGSAANDVEAKITPNDTYLLRREYALALGYLGRYKEAIEEYVKLLEKQPMDYHVAYLLMDIINTLEKEQQLDRLDIDVEKLSTVLFGVMDSYAALRQFHVNNYTGYLPDSNNNINNKGVSSWTPRRLNSIPSEKEFNDIVKNREPIIISVVNDNNDKDNNLKSNIDTLFGWNTGRWSDVDYLVSKAGEESVQLEVMLKQSILSGLQQQQHEDQEQEQEQDHDTSLHIASSDTPNSDNSGGKGVLLSLLQRREFGYTAHSFRRTESFERFLKGTYFAAIEATSEPMLRSNSMFPELDYEDQMHLLRMVNYSAYMNIQPPISGKKKKKSKKSKNSEVDGEESHLYRAPLNKLIKDISPPPAFLSGNWKNMKEVGLWMGNNPVGVDGAGSGSTTSRLHSDASDNLYILLSGTKTITLLPPTQTVHVHVHTVTPTFAISSNGLSHQLRPLSAIHNLIQEYNTNKSMRHTIPLHLSSPSSSDFVMPEKAGDSKNTHFALFDSINSANCKLKGISDANCKSTSDSIGLERNSGSDDLISSTFDLQAGEMLYIPTGWMHQVTSQAGRHMAVNYWWKPPNYETATVFEKEAMVAVAEELWKTEAVKHDEL